MTDGDGGADLVQMHSRPSHHRQVRDLETAEAVLAGERHAVEELAVRRLHAPLKVVAIAEPAQRGGFGLQRTGFAGVPARELVLAQAVGMAAERKQQVAAQVVQADSSSSSAASAASGSASSSAARPSAMRSLRRIPAAPAISACARSPGAGRRLESGSRGLDRFRGTAELEHQPASRHEEGEADLVRRGEGQAALDQGERRRMAELRRDCVARRQVRRRGTRILGAVEVFRGKREVARLEPLGGPAMEEAASLVQQRFVGAVADERVAEHELAAVGTDEEVLDQQPAVVARAVEQMAQRIGRESLAEDGGGLQRYLVVARQPVHARVDQRLDRPGQARLRGLAGIEEKLEKKERVAFGALDAAGDDGRRHRRRLGRQPAALRRCSRARDRCRSAARHGARCARPRPSGRRQSASS